MKQDRLTGLLLLHIHKTRHVSPREVLKIFFEKARRYHPNAGVKCNRKIFNDFEGKSLPDSAQLVVEEFVENSAAELERARTRPSCALPSPSEINYPPSPSIDPALPKNPEDDAIYISSDDKEPFGTARSDIPRQPLFCARAEALYKTFPPTLSVESTFVSLPVQRAHVTVVDFYGAGRMAGQMAVCLNTIGITTEIHKIFRPRGTAGVVAICPLM